MQLKIRIIEVSDKRGSDNRGWTVLMHCTCNEYHSYNCTMVHFMLTGEYKRTSRNNNQKFTESLFNGGINQY